MVQELISKTASSKTQQGLIFIPDISGFTELVHTTDVETGKEITCELLASVISGNTLDLKIAEIEGDAILFYRHGQAPSVNELTHQYEVMIRAFEEKRADLEERFSIRLNLTLKVIAHYGEMVSYNLGSFEKLYGQVVVEAHRLLKNSIASGSYLLLTDALIEKAGNVSEQGTKSNKLCELYGSLRNICFTYLDYGKVG